MHQRQFPIPAPIWLPDRKGKPNSCYHPSWSGLGEGSSIWQEGCQGQLHPVCAPLVITLPRTSFFGGLVFFPDFSSDSLTSLCLLLQLWGIIKQGYKCKGKYTCYCVNLFYRWHLGQESNLSDETTKALGMKENLGLGGHWQLRS